MWEEFNASTNMKHDSNNLAERYFVLAIKNKGKKVLLIATVYETNAG
jgi:hypothetical protein